MNFHSEDHEAMTERNGDNLQDEKMIGAIFGRVTHPGTKNKSSYLGDDSCLFYWRNEMKNIDILSSIVGIIAAFFTTLFGGWTAGMTTLMIFMAVDYLSGIIVAGVFKKSKKSENGALESRAGFKGLCRKGMILIVVLIAYRLDLLLNTTYIRDMVVIGFCTNELVSIVENAGLMGIPLPAIITKAIDVLKKKAEFNEDNIYE